MWGPVPMNLKLKSDLKLGRNSIPESGVLMAAMSHLLHYYGMDDKCTCAQLNSLRGPLGGYI